MTKLILEIDNASMWRCLFYTSKDQDGYENQCVLHNVGGCDGLLDLRPAGCPLKIDDSERKYAEFKLGVKDYLDKTDQLYEALKAGYDDLCSKHIFALEAIQILSEKVNMIAVEQGIFERKLEEIN